ncbi:MAG: hypothetical protein IK045_06920 [Bacteroidales bacterium]|nr:hypothetical protein [Bacteroidales bacterium]
MKRFLLLLTMLVPMFGCANGRPGGQIVSYEYRYSGCMVHPIVSYELVRSASGKQTLSYSHNDGVIHSVVLQEDALDKIDLMARRGRLCRLKERYTPLMRILDGYTWSLRISYERDSISSHGNNAYPSHRKWDVIEAINAYLEELIAGSAAPSEP